MKHKHYEVISKWIEDTSQIVQFRLDESEDWQDIVMQEPSWYDVYQYRIKPDPKPDLVIDKFAFVVEDGSTFYTLPDGTLNLRLIFDGETKQLKDAKVLT
jgi:hypothetical protein